MAQPAAAPAPPGSGTREFYAPVVIDYQPSSSPAQAPTPAQTVSSPAQTSSGSTQGGVSGMQAAPVASEQVPPPSAQPASNFAHTSEKIAVAGPGAPPAVDSEAASGPAHRHISGWVWFFLLLGLLCIVGLALGLGIGLGLQNHPEIVSLPAQSALSSSTLLSGTLSSSTGQRSQATFATPTDFSGEASTYIVTVTESNSAAVVTMTNVPLPSFDIGGIDAPVSTYALAESAMGSAVTTVTIVPLPPPVTTGVQTASIFHSSTFSPVSYVSTITYTAPPSGSTSGIGIVGCPANDLTGYVASNGALFQKLCFSDVGQATNIGSQLVNSLDECIEACTQASFEPAGDSSDSPEACQAVAYSANITLAYTGQRANCWFKSVTGMPTPGDWQQATARFLGFVVTQE